MLFFWQSSKNRTADNSDKNLAVSAQSKQDTNIPTGKITKKARVQRPPF